jgi:hypothetical protein
MGKTDVRRFRCLSDGAARAECNVLVDGDNRRSGWRLREDRSDTVTGKSPPNEQLNHLRVLSA